MKRLVPFLAGWMSLATAGILIAETRVDLLPRLQPGQILNYWVDFHAEKIVKTESRVATPMAPDSSPIDAHGLLRIEIQEIPGGGKPAVHAVARFLKPDAGAKAPTPSVEFTISSDGTAQGMKGADALTAEQRQIWDEWLARFASAWALPSAIARIGEKWKWDQPETAASPIAGLYWARETQYVRNERCRASVLSPAGTISSSNGPHETCAVLLTAAALRQKSSPNDATPDEYKLHSLRTAGTAGGTTEIITYISLKTGLVVRATEETGQFMDVVISKADASNRIHYNVDAKSRAEVLLLEPTPSSRP